MALYHPRVTRLLGCCALVWASSALAAPSVMGLGLPSRSQAQDLLEKQADEVAAKVAERLGGTLVSRQKQDDPRLKRAHGLYLQGAFPEAATTFDAALEDGAARLDRVSDASAFLA